MSGDPVRRAMIKAITHALETMAFLEARAVASASAVDSTTTLTTSWSWVKVLEPCPGMIALAFQPALARDIARAMIGGGAALDASAVSDAQAEMTNVIAGRMIHELLGDQAMLSLGIPRSGRGAPDVKDPGWVGQAFVIGEHTLMAFVQGAGLTAAAKEGTRPTSITMPNEATRSLEDLTPISASPTGGHPETIANFRITGLLGEGGMGMVYRARHLTLEREVALKVMRPEFARNEQFAKRFLREARVAARIDHPHVVNVYDAGIEGGNLYIAMRYIPGGDLAGLLRGRGTCPEDEALVLIGQSLMGLRAIAEHGMIHRDIKPANILLEDDGSPRLADLGLARLVVEDDGLSQPGTTQGTPSYMSPEQARGSREIDIRSDIYSLGATLYTMLVGHPPFAGATIYETVAQVLYEQPKSPRQVNPTVSIEVDAIVMRAIAKLPLARYQTPDEFIGAIEAVLALRDRKAKMSPGPTRTALRAHGHQATAEPQSLIKRLFRSRQGR